MVDAKTFQHTETQILFPDGDAVPDFEQLEEKNIILKQTINNSHMENLWVKFLG